LPQDAKIRQNGDGRVDEILISRRRDGKVVFDSNECVTRAASITMDWSGPKFVHLKIPVNSIEMYVEEGEEDGDSDTFA
jgi:hypothetical protein